MNNKVWKINDSTKKTGKKIKQTQGSNATKNGKDKEETVSYLLQASFGKSSEVIRYKALWYKKQLNRADVFFDKWDLLVEVKSQMIGGSADVKMFAEIDNAFRQLLHSEKKPKPDKSVKSKNNTITNWWLVLDGVYFKENNCLCKKAREIVKDNCSIYGVDKNRVKVINGYKELGKEIIKFKESLSE